MNVDNKNLKILLFIIVCVEGFISLGIELIAIRQIVPFAGSNILNTSIIIGFFLLSLSLGYYRGGLVNKNYLEKLSLNLTITFIIFSIGISYFFILFLFYLVPNILLGVLAFSVLVIIPSIYFLGQTIPLATNFFKDNISRVSGTLLFLSTIGSFLGAICTSAILMNYIGVNNTIVFFSFLIFLLLAIINIYLKRIGYLFIFAFFFLFFVTINQYPFLSNNMHSNIEIFEENNTTRILSINNSIASSFDIDTINTTFTYILKIQDIIKNHLKIKESNILVIGAGGFTVSLNDTLNNYTYVDIDKKLKEISERYFLKKNINGSFIPMEIRYFFNKYPNLKYKVIVLDAFTNRFSVPSALLTNEFYKQVSDRLIDDGYVFINVVGDPTFGNSFSLKSYNTILNNFNCMTIPIGFKTNSNILYICRKKQSQEIYSDNRINLFDFIR
ncbi:MAG: Spermidine synthase [uncultured Campylobacterales bacterium]|uniref:Spermidine synthase n=1 Tax=uncultured Campylobacterales bacterium TaxID=352960 RepID=A0A6S6SX31_9BACT|nr:MAG: Spermidine synthase [uncultured Campylobacterales bacterium]